MKTLISEFPSDRHGRRVKDVATKMHNVSGNVTGEAVFTGLGIISHITIWKDVDGGTVQIKNSAGDAITPAAITDYGGSFMLKLAVINGCTITTANFTGGLLSVFYTD